VQRSPDLLSISSQRCQRYRNTLGVLAFRWSFGSDSPGAWGRVLGPPAGGGWRRCHSAPLEDRTLCFAPLRAPGDGEHQSYPPPAGPSRWPVKATHLFSCYPYKDIGRGYTAYLVCGPGGRL